MKTDNRSITPGESVCLLVLVCGLFWLLFGFARPQVKPPLISTQTYQAPYSPSRPLTAQEKKKAMALPTGPITVSGAGDNNYNTVYSPSGTVNGLTQYVAANGRVLYGEPGSGSQVVWYLNTAVRSGSGHDDAYRNTAGTVGNIPTTGWGAYFGTSPAPTLSYAVAPSVTRTATNAVLSDTAPRGLQTRSRAAAAVLLTSAAFGTITPAPRTLAPVVVVNGLFAQTAQRGPVSLVSRTAANGLLSEASPVRGSVLPDTTATEPPLLTSAGTRGAASFALRTAGNNLILTEAGRGGRLAPAGSTPVPIVLLQRPLFTQSVTRSAVTLASRSPVNALFTQSVQIGARGRVRTATNALLFQSARCLGIRPAPVPGMVDPRDPFQVFHAELLYLASLKEGSAVAFADKILAIFDTLAASYHTQELNQTANTLSGLPVLIRGGDGTPGNTTYGFGQDGPILDLLPAADALIASASPAKILDGLYRPILTKIDGVLIGMGYASLNVFLTSLNSAAPGTYLAHPNAALLYYLYKNQQGALLLSPGNVFAPQTGFGMGTVGAGGAVTFTDLNFIPAANITSPTPGLSAQGYTGSKGIALLVTAAVNGTLAVTVTDGAGVTWTAALDNKAAGQTVAMTPGTAGARVLDVVSCTGSGTATAGAFQVNSVLERVVS